MNREEIIKMAREVGYPLVEYEGTPYIPPMLAVLLEAVAAAQRTWVGLTDEEATKIWESTDDKDSWELLKRVEAKLKAKNDH